MSWEFNQFHFLRPEWLILLPIVVALWWFIRKASAHQQWREYFPQAMLDALQVDGAQRSSHWHWWLLVSWLFLSFAMAGPTWIKQPVPVVKNQKAIVIALDLSPSMLADDLTPNRLTRAKYKLIDILGKQADGQMALIAYAGDAHTVSPLTDDPQTIEVLLPALTPNVMPSSGSNIEAAVELAQTLLRDAGILSGEILVLTDGMTEDAIQNVKKITSSAHRLSILGVGSAEAAPVKSSDGRLVRNSNGEIVLASVNRQQLQTLANSLNGGYSDLTTDDADINYLLSDRFESEQTSEKLNDANSFDSWKDLAHWLALFVLPLALLCFRKGVIYLLPIFIFSPLDSQAADIGLLDKIFKTKDQQAVELFQNEKYDDAADTFKDPNWSAVAKYRNGDFGNAAEGFSNSVDSVTNNYNRANSLARSGQLEQALDTYTQVLEDEPEHEDAAHNKKIIEELLKQQEQQQQEQQQSEQEQSEQEQSEQEQSEQEQSEQEQSEQEQSEQEQSEQEQAEQEQAEQEQAEQEQAEQEQAEQEQAEQEQAEQEQAEQEQAKQEQAEQEQAEQDESEQEAESAIAVESDETPLKDSSEEWLRTIEDDPSFFLRRKFNAQSQSRQNQRRQNSTQQNRY